MTFQMPLLMNFYNLKVVVLDNAGNSATGDCLPQSDDWSGVDLCCVVFVRVLAQTATLKGCF